MAEPDTNTSSLAPDYADMIADHETHGLANPDTTGNAHSTALGRHQFLAGTWMGFAKANPGLFQGMSDQEILDKRTDPNYSKMATEWYGRFNAGILQQRGFAPTAANLGLAHSFGGAGAAGLLSQPDATLLSDALAATQGPDAARRIMMANPAYVGLTVGQIKNRFSGMDKAGNVPAPVPAPVPPGATTSATAATAALDPRIAQLQKLAMLNNLVTPQAATARPTAPAPGTGGLLAWAQNLPTSTQATVAYNPQQNILNLQRQQLLRDLNGGNSNPLLLA